MAKRRSGGDTALNLDSLMDTVTNVVGILMIVLIMVSLNIATSIEKILSDLPPVELVELERLKKEVLETKPQQDPVKMEEEIKKLDEVVKKQTDELKTLDLSADKQNVKMVDLDELRKQLEDRKKARDESKLVVDKLLSDVDRLKKLLDDTPVYVPPPATVVKLPNPREMPKDATVQRFLVTFGRVYYLNDTEFMNFVVGEIEKNQKALVHGEVPVLDAFGNAVMETVRGKEVPKTKTVLSQQKIAQHFVNLRLPVRDLALQMILSPNSSRMPMRLTPNPQGGETVEQFKNPASAYQRLIRKFKGEANTVVWFYVVKDSVEAFLAARDYADNENVPVVWEIYGNPYFQRNVAQFEVNHTPAKPTPPPTTPAVRIAAPKTTVD